MLRPAVASNVPLGHSPGIYDFRVTASGFADGLMTNLFVEQDGCDPRTAKTQVFMQRLP